MHPDDPAPHRPDDPTVGASASDDERDTSEASTPPLAGDREVAPPVPWAMQLVVLRDRHHDQREVDVCETAARAVVALVDDERSRPGGPWHEAVAHWTRGGRIRKLVRRADGKRWDDVQALPGVTVADEPTDTAVRAFVPAPAHPLPKVLDKLQVGGTTFETGGASEAPDAHVVIEVSPLAGMTSGKKAAQCGHAAQLAYDAMDTATRDAWRAEGFRVRVTTPTRDAWAQEQAQVSVVDAGYTELDGPTETARAVWTMAPWGP